MSDVEFMACPECGEETVMVVTAAKHVSDYVYSGSNGWEAENDDNSWKPIDGTETYTCDSCQHEWPCRDEIEYVWND